jgi:MFS family permease
MDTALASRVMTAALVLFMCMQPAFGALSDRIGRRTNMLAFGGLGMLFTVPLLSALGTVSDPVTAFLLIVAALVIISFYTSISGLIKAELFPMEVRALGVGLSYAIGNAMFGGTAEAAALWFKSIGIESAFYYYVSGMLGLAFLTALVMPHMKKAGGSGIAEDLRS